MAKGYLSNRQKTLKVGISSYTESSTVLEVTGRVGIGTTNAQYPLDVNGDINFNGSLYQNGSQFVASRWTVGSGTTIYRNSRVGIGITNPTQDLDVNGNIRIRGGIYDGLNNSAGTNLQVPVADGNGGWSWQGITATGAITNASSGITLREEGNVVGTSGSITTLDFKGANIVVTSPVGGSIGTVTLSDTPSFECLDVTGISTLGFIEEDLRITKNLTLGSNKKYYTLSKNLILEGNTVLTIGSGSTIIVDRFNNLDDVKAISVTAGTFKGSGSNLTGIVTYITAGSGISIDKSTGNVTISGQSYWSSTTAGIHTLSNVGIGTTNPTNALTVNGTISANLFVGDGSGLTGVVGSGSGIVIYDDASLIGTASTIVFGNTLTVSPISNGIATVTSNATSANTASTIVLRDESGNFSAGTITANLTGTATTATNLANAANITTGTINDARLPDLITSNINITSGVSTFATVKATTFEGALTGTATSTTNIPNLTGDVTSVNTTTTLATVNSNVGTFGSSTAIPSITVNAKGLVTGVTTNAITVGDGTLTLATSGTGLSGSASFTANQSGNATFTVTSNATSVNTASAIVARDASGNFSAGTITANLTGTATTATNLADAANITTGTINSNRLSGTYNINVSYASTAGIATVSQGLTGTPNISVGVATATSFVKSGGTSSQFLKADGSVDTNTYLTSFSETDTLNTVTSRGNSTSNGISVGVLTATTGNFSGIVTSSGAVISGVVTSNGFNATTGNDYKINGTSVLTSTTLGSNVVNSSLTSVGTLGQLNVTGVVTASSFVGTLTGTATTATNLADAANITTGTINSNRLSGTYNININGSAGYATTAGIATVAQGLTGTPNINVGNVNSTGIATATQFSTGSGTIGITTNTISGPATITIDPSTVGDNTGTVVIKGDLQIDGTTTTVNSTVVNIDDLNITLASGAANAAAADGAGITIDGANATLTYSSTGDKWALNKDVEAPNFNSTSDANLKENVEVYKNALEVLQNIEGVKFNWKETQKPSIGVVAQQIENFVPELVQTGDEFKTVNYNGLVGLLIEAVKELSAEVKELKAKKRTKKS